MGKHCVDLAIKNCNIILDGGVLCDGVLLISKDKIYGYGKAGEIDIPDGCEVIDAGGKYVGPGFVDLHNHGGGGCGTFIDPVGAAEYFLSHGATSMLASPYYSLNFESMMTAIRTVKENIGAARNFRGLYMEGPYTSPEFGANTATNPWRHGIVESEYRALVDEAGDLAKVWVVAPERDGLEPFLRYAREVNPSVVIALGHSKALPEKIRSLGEYRPTLMTHTFNATGRSDAPLGTLGVGPDEYALITDEMYCELISDSLGIHVHPEMQKLLLHAKGVDKVVLITDCADYNRKTRGEVPEKYKHVTDLNFDPFGDIAGSKLTMDVALRNVMKHTGVGISDAFKMASLNPARAIGLDSEIGSIAIGKRADLVIVDTEVNVDTVILGGEICKFA